MDIKVGDIEYFTLLDLQDKLRYFGYNKLDLVYLDKLRAELEIKIESINLAHNQNIKKKLDEKNS